QEARGDAEGAQRVLVAASGAAGRGGLDAAQMEVVGIAEVGAELLEAEAESALALLPGRVAVVGALAAADDAAGIAASAARGEDGLVQLLGRQRGELAPLVLVHLRADGGPDLAEVAAPELEVVGGEGDRAEREVEVAA